MRKYGDLYYKILNNKKERRKRGQKDVYVYFIYVADLNTAMPPELIVHLTRLVLFPGRCKTPTALGNKHNALTGKLEIASI